MSAGLAVALGFGWGMTRISSLSLAESDRRLFDAMIYGPEIFAWHVEAHRASMRLAELGFIRAAHRPARTALGNGVVRLDGGSTTS